MSIKKWSLCTFSQHPWLELLRLDHDFNALETIFAQVSPLHKVMSCQSVTLHEFSSNNVILSVMTSINYGKVTTGLKGITQCR